MSKFIFGVNGLGYMAKTDTKGLTLNDLPTSDRRNQSTILLRILCRTSKANSR